MSGPISVQRMVPLVAAKIENPGLRTWTPTQTVSAIDDAVQELLTKQGENRQDHELDYLDLNVAAATAAAQMALTGQDILEWRVPEIVQTLRLIEDTTASDGPIEIPFSQLGMKEFERESRARRTSHFWVWGKGSIMRPRICFVGSLKGVSTIRAWYIRRAAPLHYGTAKSGMVGPTEVASTQARIQFDPTGGAGVVFTRLNLYDGAMVEFGNGTTTAKAPYNSNIPIPGITDSIRTLNNSEWVYVDPAGVVPVMTHVFDEHLYLQTTPTPTVWPCFGVKYSLIPQINANHHELVILKAAVRQAEEAGAMRTLETLFPKLQQLEKNFIESTTRRQDQTQEYVMDLSQNEA